MSNLSINQAQQPVELTNNASQEYNLRECTQHVLANYFAQLGDRTPLDLYDMVIKEVELPMLQEAMKYTRSNQSRAAIILGLSRGTLRKKLKEHNID